MSTTDDVLAPPSANGTLLGVLLDIDEEAAVGVESSNRSLSRDDFAEGVVVRDDVATGGGIDDVDCDRLN